MKPARRKRFTALGKHAMFPILIELMTAHKLSPEKRPMPNSGTVDDDDEVEVRQKNTVQHVLLFYSSTNSSAKLFIFLAHDMISLV